MDDIGWLSLQGYISLLDEDLGKAQERIGSALADDHNSSAKQNEMLKAAAKQVGLLQIMFSMPVHVCYLVQWVSRFFAARRYCRSSIGQ